MTELELSCIQSWKEVLPDYGFKLWNESNFDYSAYAFSAKAYQLGKFAFVSDICRLHALYTEGGIYLDTDMLVLKDFKGLLKEEFFLGEEKEGLISAGIIGTTKNNPQISGLLDKYKQLTFDYDAPLDIPTFLTSYLERDKAKVYTKQYFYPLPFAERGKDFRPFVKAETYAVHLWNHSWKNEWQFLNDKNFRNAWTQYMNHLFDGPLTSKKLYFPVQFCKFYVAQMFPGLYGKVKSQQNQ
ncbi:Glycosyltransferase sugar-binding region containing DXD motif-containing protein [Algoriphagus ornithinivorans]|uniref:Glycosyltransferase sugar-binding region containing DXD motif-containing protein n=1 Tax=Algoriphagus ornithinivorans TaxID=226506 RepID=A0A1I5HJ10_9BACT|nr:glycosyltransferase [Algoriphagus ornithinivorans]SFO47936.1 Glycosyltransferase sugar-binding region containing DXD motif-containing protein [Algoriphagus ornithinivorans]